MSIKAGEKVKGKVVDGIVLKGDVVVSHLRT